MSYIISIVISALAIYLASLISPGVSISDLYTATISAIILGLINVFIKPILSLLTLPITLITFGLFSVVLNTAIILFVANIVGGFAIESFFHGVLFSFIYAIIQTLLKKLTL